MKRKLSLILAFAMLISTVFTSSVFAADTTQTAQKVTSFDDVTSETKYRDAIITLSKLGIINGYEENNTSLFKPDNNITRAEFTAIVTRAMNLDGVAVGATSFTDISDHWAKSNIQIAADKKIVNGFEDNTFRPDENVTYEQAIKMMVCTLGYDSAAQALGGWPTGYTQQGTKLGLTTGITDSKFEEPATRGTIAKLMYNAFDIDAIDPNVPTTSENTKTFLEKYMNMTRAKGKLVGVEDSVTSECTITLGKGQMSMIINNQEHLLDFSEYTSDKSELEQYLGYDLSIFYEYGKNGESDKLVMLDEETQRNEVTTVASNDIDSLSGSSLKYFDQGDKSRTINLKNGASVIYNNVLSKLSVLDAAAKWLDPKSEDFIYGEVKFTTGNDGSISVINITDYDVMVAAKAPTSSDYRITNKLKFTDIPYRQSIILDPEDVSYEYTITKDGAKSSVTSIKLNDVVLIAASEDETKYTVTVSSDTVSGSISAISENDLTISIDGKKYPVSAQCLTYCDENNIELKTSAQITAYLDSLGTIQFISLEVNSQNSPLVYIARVMYTDDDESDVMADIFVPSSNGVQRYNFRDKVKVNGESVDEADALEMLEETSEATYTDGGKSMNYQDEALGIYDDDVVKGRGSQVARITLSGGEISAITTLSDVSTGSQSDNSNELTRYTDLEKLKYNGSNNFANKFYVNSSSTIIFVPQDRTDTKSYSKKSTSFFTYNSEYYVQAFNVSSSKVAELVLVYGSEASSTAVTKTTPMYLVGSKPSIASTDEGLVSQFDVYASTNTKTTITASNDTDFEDVQVGDIIQFGRDSSENAIDREDRILVDDIKDVLNGDTLDWNDDKFQYETPENYTTNIPYGRIFMANVIEVMEEGSNYAIRVTKDGFEDGEIITDNEEKITVNGNTKFIRVDTTKGEASPYVDGTTTNYEALDLSDAKTMGTDCSKIAVYVYANSSNTAKFIVVYE